MKENSVLNVMAYKIAVTVLFGLYQGPLQASASSEHKFLVSLQGTPKINPSSSIRVRIFPHTRSYKPHGRDKDMSKVQFAGEKPCKMYRGEDEVAQPSQQLIGLSNYLILDANTLEHPIYLQCEAPTTLKRAEDVPDFTYKGDFYIRSRTRKGVRVLEVVNILSLQDYLKGVVPSEVYPGWPMETLKTQAVAARSYAVFHLKFSRRFMDKVRTWDVDDTIAYQAYTGIDLGSSRTDVAVMETEGQILTHQGAVIQAYYHADSGGQTEDAVNVWGLDIPYVQGRKESFDFKVSSSTWRLTLNLNRVQKKLRRLGILRRSDRLKSLAVPFTGRSDSGRVRAVMLGLSNNRTKLIPISKFKRAFGKLPSTLFAFDQHPSKAGHMVLTGMGQGHGVGMSQRGASILAGEKGWSYFQILDYYYTDTKLCRLSGKGKKLPYCYDKKLQSPNAS